MPHPGQTSCGGQHEASIKAQLLSKISDTTAARYLRSVQLFFSGFEELGGQLANIDQDLFLDAFSTLCLAALRMARSRKTSSRLSAGTRSCLCFHVLAGPLRTVTQEKRESKSLPLCFLAFLERTPFQGPPALRSASGQAPFWLRVRVCAAPTPFASATSRGLDQVWHSLRSRFGPHTDLTACSFWNDTLP